MPVNMCPAKKKKKKKSTYTYTPGTIQVIDTTGKYLRCQHDDVHNRMLTDNSLKT